MNLEMTGIMKRYLIKLLMRIGAFLWVLYFYITDKAHIWNSITGPMFDGLELSLMEVLWTVFMGIMILHLFPTEKRSMALRKEEGKYYRPRREYEEIDLLRFVQKQNVRAWRVMLLWLCFNAVFGILFVFDVLDEADLFMLTVFFFLCDYICILFFCPFQTFVMENRCCVNCRIYDWGHFMMFTPMLFIRNFFCWSLFFTSVVVLIHWEIQYAKFPERFWSGSNDALRCASCKDKTCQIKRQVTPRVFRIVKFMKNR